MCGVVGIINRENAPTWAARGLYALQHRGHDSCGLATVDKQEALTVTSGKGAVADVLPVEKTEQFDAKMCIGQNLYTTFGTSHTVQPFGGRFWDSDGNEFKCAVVHNGQLCGIERLRRKYACMYSSHSDSEVIFALLPHMKGNTIFERIESVVKELEGAFSLIFISPEGLTAVRDPNGFRPLIMGQDENGGTMFASEINAFEIMEGSFQRQVEPGEIIHVSNDGTVKSKKFGAAEKLSQCVFEHIYFARPDNQLFGKPGYSTQQKLGSETAKEIKNKIEGDIVVPVPDSATIAGLGFAKELGIPLEMGILRHHFASRTFITRGQTNRERAVRLKFSVVKDVIQGKRIFLADDSLVRATTSKILISMLRKGGAKEIHVVLFSPHILYSCIYGINTPTREELIAFKHNSNNEEIAKIIGADSVSYLSKGGLEHAMGADPQNYCYACMDGEYPIPAEGIKSPQKLKVSEKFSS
jgi:amidophosphoribosyltransferase